MQWRQHEHLRLHQDTQLMSTEPEAAQHCCGADCHAEQEEDEEALAQKVRFGSTSVLHKGLCREAQAF